jgi:tRNA(adenine34) deaminase
MLLNDEYFMREALKEAKIAFDNNEVPIGAVLVCNNIIIAKAHNQTELLQDPTAHAEILALTAGTTKLGSKFLNECTLYVSLEPCPMCAGACFWTRVGKIVYATQDKKRGFELFSRAILHPKTKLKKGILEKESKDLLKKFFESKRGNPKIKS